MGKLRLKVVRRLLGGGGRAHAFLLSPADISRIAPPISKGNQINISEPGCGYWGGGSNPCSNLFFPSQGGGGGVYCGNANEFGDASGSPGKSYLFFLT